MCDIFSVVFGKGNRIRVQLDKEVYNTGDKVGTGWQNEHM